MNKKIRVFIVDDSPVCQGLLKGILAVDARFEVIGQAANGKEAVEFIAKNNPDIVSMDINMPVMDGITATRLIMEKSPVPIVIISSLYDPTEVKLSFSVLEAGALTILPKPHGPGHPLYHHTARNYRHMLHLMSEINVMAKQSGRGFNAVVPGTANAGNLPATAKDKKINVHEQIKIIAIGASAGGPQAIQQILNGLPQSLRVPILIVQHIDANFAEGFCEWLKASVKLTVQIARDGEILKPGHVYLAPGDHHLGLKMQGVASVTKDPPEKGLRPAVSYLFAKVAETYGKNSMCILLTGMGNDGAAELKILYDLGALTIAQDSGSSLVHGMPGEAIRLGGALKILPPEDILREIKKL